MGASGSGVGTAAGNATLKKGFTTGSCAALASRAAAEMLFSGREITHSSIETPAGEIFTAKISYVNLNKGVSASCAVLKDGGDDPDVTTGLYIYSKVSAERVGDDDSDKFMSTQNPTKIDTEIMLTSQKNHNSRDADNIMLTKAPASVEIEDDIIIEIDGGEGVGRVTKPGLDRSVGEAAINSTPRAMIDEAVRAEAVKAGFKGRLKVIISAPGGEDIAKKTFNPRLGIEGGISILGTSGVENPMSTQAIIDTIEVEMKVHRAAGENNIAVTPGNYGQDYMLHEYGYDLDRSVKCSNFIGDAIRIASELGFDAMLLTGHIGKLIKLTGGITNTHSANGDCRMELLSAAALREGCDAGVCREILDAISTERALKVIEQAGALEKVMEYVLKKAMYTLERKAGDNMRIECIIYSNDFGCLALSRGAVELLETIRERG